MKYLNKHQVHFPFQVHFLTGRYNDAMKDAEKDLHYKHDGSAYVMAGILSYKIGVSYLFIAMDLIRVPQTY